MGRKFGWFRRKPLVRTVTVMRTVRVTPDSADFLPVDDVVRGLGRQYVAISREIEPLIGKHYSREYFFVSLGRMDQIANTIAGLTGRYTISVSAGLDHERVFNTRGEQIDLELDDCFDSYRLSHSLLLDWSARDFLTVLPTARRG